MSNFITSLKIELPGAQMLSSQLCDENSIEKEYIKSDFSLKPIKVETRKKKPAYQVIKVTDAILTKNMSIASLEEQLRDIAEALGGKAVSYTFPFDRDKKRRFGEIINL